MTKEELDKLWELYREFCNRANQANMVMNVPEFFAWIEKFKVNNQNIYSVCADNEDWHEPTCVRGPLGHTCKGERNVGIENTNGLLEK